MTPEQALVDRMWQRYAGVAAQRVALLEDFAAALADGTTSEVQRSEALTAAHKLAGSLGTYGRPGSERARELEQLLAAGGDLSGVQVLVAVLRQSVASPVEHAAWDTNG